MATLTVGSGAGFDYSTLASAVAASQDGDVIQVQAGTYTNDFAEITTSITIEGVGGMVNLVATDTPLAGERDPDHRHRQRPRPRCHARQYLVLRRGDLRRRRRQRRRHPLPERQPCR